MPPKGTKHTQKSKEKMSVSAKERLKNPLNNNFYGKTHTLEVKNRLSKFRMGKTLEEVGHKIDCTCNFCKAKRGELHGVKNYKYIDGRTPLVRLIRNCELYFRWRNEVFKRDKYTCQICGQVSGNIEAHHKKRFIDIFIEWMHPFCNSFNGMYDIDKDKDILFEIAKDYKPFWDISNGQTLCEICHDKIN